ncbi:MAG: hypothetical protein R3251_04500 [Candidatus Spechtbacterales bacterium]|nr:hypothetical protein [Candidatus Spechtbacterales bacterium]
MTDSEEPSKHRGVRIEKIRFRHLTEHFKLLFKPQLSELYKKQAQTIKGLRTLAERYRGVQIYINKNRLKALRPVFRKINKAGDIYEIATSIAAVVAVLVFSHYAFAAAVPSEGLFVPERDRASMEDERQTEEEDEEEFVNEPMEASYSVRNSAFRAASVPPIKKEDIVVSKYWVPITAYSSTPDQTDSTPFTTASGTRVRDGIVAANFLPIGTKIKIPEYYGDKVFVVEDRMNARYWQKVDIWMPTKGEALSFGLRNTYIEVIQEI